MSVRFSFILNFFTLLVSWYLCVYLGMLLNRAVYKTLWHDEILLWYFGGILWTSHLNPVYLYNVPVRQIFVPIFRNSLQALGTFKIFSGSPETPTGGSEISLNLTADVNLIRQVQDAIWHAIPV